MRKISAVSKVNHNCEYRHYLPATNTIHYISQMYSCRALGFSYSMLQSYCEVPFSSTEIFFCLLFYLPSFFPSIKPTYYSCGFCVTEALTLTLQTLIPELWLQAQPRRYCINICMTGVLRCNLPGKGIFFYASEVETKPLPCSRLPGEKQAPARSYSVKSVTKQMFNEGYLSNCDTVLS